MSQCVHLAKKGVVHEISTITLVSSGSHPKAHPSWEDAEKEIARSLKKLELGLAPWGPLLGCRVLLYSQIPSFMNCSYLLYVFSYIAWKKIEFFFLNYLHSILIQSHSSLPNFSLKKITFIFGEILKPFVMVLHNIL